MLTLQISLFAAVVVFRAAYAIQCYQCQSNEDIDCKEKFDKDNTRLAPLSCDRIFEARYCIKTTGMYNGEIGTRRFCSSRDHGNYCEYISRPGDEREYRSCVYTCTGNGCNSANSMAKAPSLWHLAMATAALLEFKRYVGLT